MHTLISAVSPLSKNPQRCFRRFLRRWLNLAAASFFGLAASPHVWAAVLFEDSFSGGIPGWTAVQPPGAYLDGPLRWQYDVVAGAFSENSNIYTDSASSSPTGIAPMLINDKVTAVNFTFSARLTAGDDDGFGLIFGYQNPTNFYRVVFARQSRTGFPWTGWCVDRMLDGQVSNLFGAGTPGYSQTFVNTAGRPFDVTVTVDTSSRLTLTVLDNPTSSPVNYPLVSTQDLPGPANGKVGLFTWGMSGGSPSGWRAQNLTLTPAGLSGDPNSLSAAWTHLVPPRANGSTAVSGGNGQPLWGLGVGAAGPDGFLVESSDCFGGNDASGQIDFTGPTMVAGNENWSDYIVAARITPHDDDGHGILLRYANSTNFYRIALRAQSSSIGIPRGLSVQKNVNRAYSEVSRETSPQYIPQSGVTYDLIAAITGNSLDVTLVADPEGTAQVFSYGPWTVSGVPTGKVGLFSWAMSRTDFDWVTVQDGTPLYVSSTYGSCDPPRGLSSFSPGEEVNATASPPSTPPGTRVYAKGWLGTGSVPASGNGSNVVFTLNTFSRLEWLWQPQYQLVSSNTLGGTIVAPLGEWHNEGALVQLTATPDPGFAFGGWKGTLFSTATNLNVVMNQPHEVTAFFTADSDADGLPDDWELTTFGTLDESPSGDPDNDGRTTGQEYENGTHPLVADIFRIEHLALNGNNSTLTISNTTGTRYSVERSTSPNGAWTTIATAQTTNSFVTTKPTEDSAYWRLQQPGRPNEALPFVPGSWTIVVLPDTQVYAMNYPDLFIDQTRWIVENRVRHNIQYVLHLGDITNNNNTNQWTNAKAAMSMLDGVVPYAMAPGNHDYGPNGGTADRTTLLNDFFPVPDYLSWPTFGGVMEPGKMDNTYHLFSAGGVDWIILALEFGPRDNVVTWANSVLASHPDRKAILITHAYLYYDSTRYDWATKGSVQSWNPHGYPTGSSPEGTNDGEELWQKMVKLHPNFSMTINGHVLNDGLGYLASTNDAGKIVHQMLVNYQMQTLGGEAFLRLLEFLPDGKTVQVRAFSPMRGTYKTDPQNQFTFTLQP